MPGFLRPSFFIIGERKCGTSSLFRYLLEHPQVLPGERKEMQFFSQGPQYVADHFDAYLRRFPSAEGCKAGRLRWPELDDQGILFEQEIEYPRQEGAHYRTGEASADTFAAVPPQLLKQYLPDLRLIVLLRDPVERVFSHHRMLRRFADEGRELPEPVSDFASDMRAEMAADGSADGPKQCMPLLSLGIYTQKLQAWKEHWGHDSLLVLFADHLQDSEEQPRLLERVRQHLSLEPWPSPTSRRPNYNQAPPATMPPDIRSELQAFYEPHNAQLRDYLRCELPWEHSA